MALVNRLIREARLGATELLIKPSDVGTITEDIIARPEHHGRDRDAVRQMILDGKVKMLGAKIRVLGSAAPAPLPASRGEP